MQQLSFYIGSLLLLTFTTLHSFAQQKVPMESALTANYEGSTPCDSVIRYHLGIPLSSKCDFIQWQLSLESTVSDTFHVMATYGESKPNTLGFIKATEFLAKGKYLFSTGSNDNPNARILTLSATELKAPLLLIVMDGNVLHFADSNKRFLVGNGGWGYVLNNIKYP